MAGHHDIDSNDGSASRKKNLKSESIQAIHKGEDGGNIKQDRS